MVVKSCKETSPLRKCIGSTGAGPVSSNGTSTTDRTPRVTQQTLEQRRRFGGAVRDRIDFDAADEVAHDLRPIDQIWPQDTGRDERVGEIDFSSGTDRTNKKLDKAQGAIVRLEQFPAAIDDRGGKRLLLRQHVIEGLTQLRQL